MNSPSAVQGCCLPEESLALTDSGQTASLGHEIRVSCFRDELIKLDSGSSLLSPVVSFQTHGELNSQGDNAILICHAMTGDAHVARGSACSSACQLGWWEELVGVGKAIDTRRFFVICSNVLGGCQGTSGPLSFDPESESPYGARFPEVGIRDMVRLQYRLMKQLGVNRLAAVIGGSMGGMQALEWAAMYPSMVGAVAAIACGPNHSAWAMAFNSAARLAIQADAAFADGDYSGQPVRGFAVARLLSMISYRHPRAYQARFGRELNRGSKAFPDPFNKPAEFAVENYLRYQGHKLTERFDANSYLRLSSAMDRFDLAEGRGMLNDVLSSILCPVLCVGIDSDLLYPPEEQRFLAKHLPRGAYAELQSDHGHDAFLIEIDQLEQLLKPWIDQHT